MGLVRALRVEFRCVKARLAGSGEAGRVTVRRVMMWFGKAGMVSPGEVSYGKFRHGKVR